jgi:hypothetical protein
MRKLGYGPDNRLKIKVTTRDWSLYRDPAVLLIDQLKQIYIDGEHAAILPEDPAQGIHGRAQLADGGARSRPVQLTAAARASTGTTIAIPRREEIAPRVTRAAILRDPTVAVGIGQLGAMQSVAPALGVELFPVDVRDPREIERAVAAFARVSSNGGLIALPNPLVSVHRKLIVTLAAMHGLPAVYYAA